MCCPSDAEGDAGLRDSLGPASAWTRGGKEEGEIQPGGQLRTKQGSDLPHSQGKEELVQMDNYGKI